MDLIHVRSLITVPDDEMLPPPELFLHQSTLHGQAHVGRVMIHALRLVQATALVSDARALWAAVFLHDIARVHDGRSRGHGAAAWARLEMLPDVRALFHRGGVREEDLPAIQTAVTLHSRGEPEAASPHRRLTELLKDADGLDRVRLGDLDPRYLRTAEARTMVAFAGRLYVETDSWIPPSRDHFALLWREVERLMEDDGRLSPGTPTRIE
jgi:hypothetical protein